MDCHNCGVTVDKRKILKKALSQCTQPQQDFFHKMYPGGIDNIPEEKLSWAITQCENTLKVKKRNKYEG